MHGSFTNDSIVAHSNPLVSCFWIIVIPTYPLRQGLHCLGLALLVSPTCTYPLFVSIHFLLPKRQLVRCSRDLGLDQSEHCFEIQLFSQ